jgi:tRNA(Ile)-lysidine synthase
VAVQASSIKGALRVRSRRPGDRLRPLGAPGRRKVQDLLVDRKVPRAKRDRVPIVVDETGQIVWVAGHALADQCRVTAPECGVVLLKIIDL